MELNSFGDRNSGLQIGVNNAPINAHFSLPAGLDRHSTNVDRCRHRLLLADPIFDREAIKAAKGQRAAGTCEWICNNEIYTSWLEGSSQCIWISGGPGKGKTTLSVFLTEELEKFVETKDGTHLLFYICSYQDDKRNSAAAILRSFIYQLVTKTPKTFERISSYFEDEKRIDLFLSAPEVLWTIFTILLEAGTGTLYCVLDGLDECDDESGRLLIKNLQNLFLSQKASKPAQELKLIIASRKIAELQAFPTIELEQNHEDLNNDIRALIFEKTQELQFIPSFHKIQKMVQETLIEKAEGTFLWVGFVTDELSTKTTCTEILETLNSLPSGLPGIYSRILSRIEIRRRPLLSSLLRWVTMAVRPLSLEEIAEAISVKSTEHLDREQIMLDCVAMCGNIVEIRDGKLSLVHQSAKDYLLLERLDDDSTLKDFHITADVANSQIAGSCIDYLESSTQRDKSLAKSRQSELSALPLLDYAMRHWPDHAKHASSNPDHGLDFDRDFFLEGSLACVNWWRDYSYKRGDQFFKCLIYCMTGAQVFNLKLNPIHLASYLSIEDWVKAILSKKGFIFNLFRSIDKMDVYEKTPLNHAVANGHETVAKLLLDNGAKAIGKRSLLGDAAEGGNESLVRLLLEKGVNEKQDLSEVLKRASTGKHENIVRLLLEWSASDIEEDHPALAFAALRGSLDLVKLLLERGSYSNPVKVSILHAVIRFKKEGVFPLLLNHITDFDIWSFFGSTPLGIAAECGDIEAIKALLERGADIDSRDPLDSTALTHACTKGHILIVKLLLEKGADARSDPSSLPCAAISGEGPIISMLLEAGVDINTVCHISGQTALSKAVSCDNETTVNMLLGWGADINARDRSGNTPLIQATVDLKDKEKIVKFLLEKGANPHVKNKLGKTALGMARVTQKMESVNILKESGAT